MTLIVQWILCLITLKFYYLRPDILILMAWPALPTELDALQAMLAPASLGSAGSERVRGVSGERRSGERGRVLRYQETPDTLGRATTLHLLITEIYHIERLSYPQI